MSQRNCAGREAPIPAWLVLVAALGALLGAGAGPARADDLPALDLHSVARADGAVQFDLEMSEGLPQELAEELDGGERVTVTWEVELVRDRKLWFNTTVAKLELKASAVFDPLTKRYTLERQVGKTLVDSAEAGQRGEAEAWLTRLAEARVPVEDKAFTKPRLRWRARAILDRKLVMLFVPTTVKTEWTKGEFADPKGGEAP